MHSLHDVPPKCVPARSFLDPPGRANCQIAHPDSWAVVALDRQLFYVCRSAKPGSLTQVPPAGQIATAAAAGRRGDQPLRRLGKLLDGFRGLEGLRTFSCTYTAYLRASRRSSGVSQPSACEMRPERNHRIHSSRAAENSPAPTPDQSLPWKNSCFSRPKKPSARARSTCCARSARRSRRWICSGNGTP